MVSVDFYSFLYTFSNRNLGMRVGVTTSASMREKAWKETLEKREEKRKK